MAFNNDNNDLKWPLIILFYILIIFMISGLASAATITVESGESIQAAIDRADPGDVIKVMSGAYNEDIDLSKQLILIGIDVGEGVPRINSVSLNADRCELAGFEVSGIAVHSDYNNITGNNVMACVAGISLKDCQGNIVSHNNARVICEGLMSYLRGDAIHLLNSNANIISNNVAEGGFIGIYMDSSSHNLVEDNQVGNNTNGIGLLNAVGNTIKNNTIMDNSDDGLGILKFSNDSFIAGNTMENNGDFGIYLQDSSNSTIYLNSFLGNKKNAGSKDVRSKGFFNLWHSPEAMSYSFGNKGIKSYLGNYWSDYESMDSDGDGIGDAPYKFDGGQDDYPLMKRWNDFIGA